MNNNKTTNILLGILIVVLVAIGIIVATSQNRNSYRNDMVQNNDSILDNQDDVSMPVKSNSTQQVSTTTTSSKKINWQSVTSSSVFNLYKKEDVPVGNEDKPALLQEVDLTGDGIPEAIFSASTGNASSSVIFMSNPDGSISLMKMKNIHDSISPAELWEVGMASYSMSYRLLPSDNAFYLVSRTLDENANNNDYSHFICNKNEGVAAYKWNPKTSLFEYNSVLTAKYTAIECK
jgi:hypothetical protein